MADLPFGFSPGEDPDRDKRGENDPDSGSGSADPFGLGGLGGEFDMADLGQIFTRLGQMFSGAGPAMAAGKASGPVNYELARQLASSSIGFVAPIPAPTRDAISDAVHLAETWLDGVTALPAGTSKAVAWTPNDWVDNTLETWKRLCDPMAQQIATVWAAALPDEAKNMAGPLLSMMSQMGGMAFGSQLGQALARLAREVLTSTDIGLPLGPKGIAALLPDAIESFADGLEQSRSEIVTFLAAREAAHHRLFSHVPWLASQLLGAVEAYAKGMKIDMNGIEELARDFNPATLNDPAAVEQLLTQGVFEPKAVAQLWNKCKTRTGDQQFSNADNMAIVSILSTQLLHDQLIRGSAFFERDVPYYAANRDLTELECGRLVLYRDWDEISAEARRQLAEADVGMVTSYCPDALAADLVFDSRALRVFYDLDSPVTLARLSVGEPVAYLGAQRLAGFDLVLRS